MKTNATHRAWYGRFLYKVRVKNNGKNIRQIRSWLNQKGDWKTRKYTSDTLFFIFDSDVFQELCKTFSREIVETWQPINQQAHDAMLTNVDIEIRRSLIRGKYRYRVSWPGVWRGRNVHCLAFINQHLNGTEGWDWYEGGGWEEYLYLQDKNQIMMLKMSVDPDHYRKILHIVLESEVT